MERTVLSSSWLTHVSRHTPQEELELLRYRDVNELGACAILGVCSANDFLGLSSTYRTVVFGPLLGPKVTVRRDRDDANAGGFAVLTRARDSSGTLEPSGRLDCPLVVRPGTAPSHFRH